MMRKYNVLKNLLKKKTRRIKRKNDLSISFADRKEFEEKKKPKYLVLDVIEKRNY